MKKLVYLFIVIPLMGFAQEILTEDHDLYNGRIHLPGTLSYPKLDKKLPLAIFIHGSGNPDRNGNQGPLVQANYIKQLADSLNKKGIAFYRYDKRNATPANMEHKPMEDFRIADLVEDASVAIKKFASDPRFNSLHLIGHSQGSLVGMLAVTKDVDSYISLAGPGSTIDAILIRQLNAQNKDAGNLARDYFKELRETDTIKEVNPFLMTIFAPQNQPYLRNWIAIDPAEEIKKLAIPVLILNGSEDLQVLVEDAQLLKNARPKAKLVIIPKMNHLLKGVENLTENQASYTNPDFPLSMELVKTIVEFISSNG